MTSRTSLIISGSSAEVGSSKSITLGSMARARAIATRCCWPPESWAGYLSAWWPTPTRSSSSLGLALLGLVLGHAAHLDRAERDVLEDRLVREEVEALEDHPDLGAQVRRAPCPRRAAAGRRGVIVPLSMVSSRLIARHSVRLAGPGRADHDDDLAALDRQVDVLEDVQVAEPLVDVVQHDQASPAARAARTPSGCLRGHSCSKT